MTAVGAARYYYNMYYIIIIFFFFYPLRKLRVSGGCSHLLVGGYTCDITFRAGARKHIL